MILIQGAAMTADGRILFKRTRVEDFIRHANKRGMRASDLLARCLSLDSVQELPRVDVEGIAQR